jgi:hypothetical protein
MSKTQSLEMTLTLGQLAHFLMLSPTRHPLTKDDFEKNIHFENMKAT